MPSKLNAQQSEPQRADLNVHANLSAIRHAQCSFTTWAHAASISRQWALIAWHDGFKLSDHRVDIFLCNRSQKGKIYVSATQNFAAELTSTAKWEPIGWNSTAELTFTGKWAPTVQDLAVELKPHPLVISSIRWSQWSPEKQLNALNQNLFNEAHKCKSIVYLQIDLNMPRMTLKGHCV